MRKGFFIIAFLTALLLGTSVFASSLSDGPGEPATAGATSEAEEAGDLAATGAAWEAEEAGEPATTDGTWEAEEAGEPERPASEGSGDSAASVAGEMMEELDFSEISGFLEERTEVPVTFQELTGAMLGEEEIPYETAGEYAKDLLLSGFADNRRLVVLLLAVCLAFSILKNYAKSFSGSYVSDVCFFLCYCFMMALLLKSFLVMNETVTETVEAMTGFMKALIPVYCASITLTMSAHSSAAAYSLIFTAIYLTEWMIRYLLVPLAQIYVMTEFLNHLTPEERFGRLSELISGAVRFILKAAVAFILGINLIQGMIAPAMDRLAGNTIARTIQMVPGIGNVANGTGQIFISSGLVIKNCVGASALLILLLLCVVPYLKMAVLAVLYKFLAAVLEPVADKRMSGGMNGVAGGGMLYLRILTTCLALFVLTIALTTAATGLSIGG